MGFSPLMATVEAHQRLILLLLVTCNGLQTRIGPGKIVICVPLGFCLAPSGVVLPGVNRLRWVSQLIDFSLLLDGVKRQQQAVGIVRASIPLRLLVCSFAD